MRITREELANMFDHTCLKPYATVADFEKLCKEARENGFKMVAINSYPVKMCKEFLSGSKVHVGAAIGFPLGQTTVETKVFETIDAIKSGADEIDYVINLTEVKKGNFDYIKDEMTRIVAECRKNNVLVKVIFENCFLTKEEIVEIALIAKKVKPDFIKTSTGFGTGGATLEDVQLMAETVGNEVAIKAAGSVRDWETCKAMIEAGATRIGTSSAFAILEGYDKEALEEIQA